MKWTVREGATQYTLTEEQLKQKEVCVRVAVLSLSSNNSDGGSSFFVGTVEPCIFALAAHDHGTTPLVRAPFCL